MSSGAARIDDSDTGMVEAFMARLAAFRRDLAQPQESMAWIAIAVLTGLLIYSYWPGLMNARASWDNPQYSHGWIVPLFTVGTLFWWRKPMSEEIAVWERLLGLALLVASFGMRLAVARYRIVTIDMYTFVPALAGVFLMVGGLRTFRWAWAPIAFLIFMYPLPDEATRYLLDPLQKVATIASTYALQTLGLDAYREGNQIVLGEMHLGVVDACSGLRMLTIFIALSVALVMLGRGEWWENAVVIASAIPIALLVNSIRITVTGLLYQIASSEVAEMVFHDLAGWVMMPMALGMLFLLQQILANLFIVEDAEVAPIVATAQRAAARAAQPVRSAVPVKPPAAARPASVVKPASVIKPPAAAAPVPPPASAGTPRPQTPALAQRGRTAKPIPCSEGSSPQASQNPPGEGTAGHPG